jgi:glycosyltransferase AglD
VTEASPEASDAESHVAISIVMPAFNEATIIERSLGELLDGLRSRGEAFEIVVVENGSTDNTATIAAGVVARNAEVRVLHRRLADYGNALRQGLLEARGDIVVNFDCDYYDIGFIARAVDRMRDADRPAAIVVGSKRAPGADDRRSWSRRLVTTTFSTVLRAGFGLTVSDTHGMKALRRDPLLPVVARCRFGRDLFDTELILRAERAGLVVAEIPVDAEELRPARTSIIRRIPRTISGLARLWFVLRSSDRSA